MIHSELAHFRIVSKLGEGGMGEVYLAEDTKLGREVAIKVLPEAFVADADRLARFEREAKVLASLSHPNIAGIHEIGEQGATHFLVMELVPGENVAERLARGPLPIDEAIAVFLQISGAMAAAHEQGIVHRDLKPGNVMITPTGDVKVLDFGLARAEATGVLSGSGPSLTQSPTATYQVTQAGTLMGTAAYMSPEQAKGQVTTRGSDIWALGCLLFEMLSGRPPFQGESLAETLASVLRAEPKWDQLPSALSPAVRGVLEQCLAKDPRRRLHDAGDVGLLVERAMTLGSEGSEPAMRSVGWIGALGWVVALLAVAWVAQMTMRSGGTEARVRQETLRFRVQPRADTVLAFADTPNVAISADGRTLAYVAVSGDSGSQIYLRELDQVEARPVPGTEGGSHPFFAPDGRHLGYFAGGELRKIATSGGLPFKLAEAPNTRGGVWSGDGSQIFFVPDFSAGIFSVPAVGGTPRAVVEPDPEAGERTFRWVDTLPGDRVLIYTVGDQKSPNDYRGARIETYALDSQERSILLANATMARFVPPDRVVFLRDAVLLAATIDLDTLSTVGEPLPVVQGVGGELSSGAGYFDVSGSGDLVYVPGAFTQYEARLALVDTEGNKTLLDLEPRGFHYPRFSPDGDRIGFSVGDTSAGNVGDLWTYSLSTGRLERLTFGDSGVYGAWTRDGSQMAFNDLGVGKLSSLATDGSGAREALIDNAAGPTMPESWSPDGETLAYTRLGQLVDIYLVTRGEEPRLFERDASSPAFSPDGRWLAYSSPPTGQNNVFVRPVEGEGMWQVSGEDGAYARWTPDPNAIFYMATQDPDRPIFRVDVLPGETFRMGSPVEVLKTAPLGARTSTAPALNWDVSPTGDRFVFVEPQRNPDRGEGMQVVLGWASELEQTTPWEDGSSSP